MRLAELKGNWRLRILSERDRTSALDFLRRDPFINVHLLSKILDEGIGATCEIACVELDGETVAMAALGSHVVANVAASLSPGLRESAIAILADRILARMVPIRAIISEEGIVDSLWARLRARNDPPAVVRLRQPIYALEELAGPAADLKSVRYGALADLDALVPACAAMHREEVGIDPLERDAVGYRERVRELIYKRRSFILQERGAIVFKAELSAVTPDVVQLMGVWTAPPFRRRGLAREGLREICGHLLKQGRSVTLFVNDFNHGAIRLYESLGFRRIGTNRALIW